MGAAHHALTDAEDHLGLDLDVGGLASDAAHRRLVDHHAGVRQGEPLALGAAREQEGAHGCGEADVDRGDVGLDVAHRVEHREAGGHRSTGAVDVHVHRLAIVLRCHHGARLRLAQGAVPHSMHQGWWGGTSESR